MPGTITFRPIEANLTHNTDLLGRMNPYCAFIVGDSIFKGQICKKGGKHPHWNDAVTVPVGSQSQVIVELMDKDRFSRDDNIGSFLINLNELQSSGQSSRWYPLTHKNKPAGEILLETTFSDSYGYGNRGLQQSTLNQGYTEGQSTLNQGFIEGQSTYTKENVAIIEQPAIIEQEVLVQQQPIIEQEVLVQQQPIIEERQFTSQVPIQERNIFTEQQQYIEPRTFMKEVDVVETRAHLENIEVLEPQRVLREVQYTQAVPVTKQIEICEPRVVMKEVEVIEPRLVTKTIQVIENVPVKKQVEVIESVPRMQEVQTFEAQTFTRQVEVTDYVPVQKQVTVTEPFHMKKNVEFVEPVITTKTITKEIAQPVIIDEKITTTVGPASVIHETDIYTNEFSRLKISEDDRLYRYGEWQRLRGLGYTDSQLNSHFSTQGWGPINSYRFHELGSSNYGNQYSNINFSNEDRLHRFGEWQRLRNQGYNDSQLDKHFTTQGWGPINSYRFHELGNTNYGSQQGNFNFSNEDRLHRFGEWQRLRNQGYNDSQLDNHFTTQGWGPIKLYRFQELGNTSNYGSQYGNINFSEEDRLHRFGEWQRLRNQGYNDSQLDNHFTTQGWGPIKHYRFYELGSKHGLTGTQSQVYQSNPSINRNF